MKSREADCTVIGTERADTANCVGYFNSPAHSPSQSLLSPPKCAAALTWWSGPPQPSLLRQRQIPNPNAVGLLNEDYIKPRLTHEQLVHDPGKLVVTERRLKHVNIHFLVK